MHFSSRLLAAPLLAISLNAGAVQAQTFGPVAAISSPPKATTPESIAELDAELFYEIFLGELTLRAGDPGAGYSLMLEAARRSNDENIFKRATEIALQSRSGDAALVAARAWKSALPASHEAQRYVLQILLALNRTSETAPLLHQFLESADPVTRKQLVLSLPLVYRKVSDKVLALNVVSGALEPYKNDPALAPASLITLGRMQLLAGEADKALASAQSASALDKSSDDVALMALDLLEAKVPGAEPLAQAAFSAGRAPELRMAYAKVLLELQRYAQAQAQLEMVTAAHAEYSQAWLALAALQLENGAVDQAEASLTQYEAAAERSPGSQEQRAAATQIYMLRSEMAEKRGEFKVALDWLERIENGDARFDVQARRALLMARDGKLTHARALVQSLPASDAKEEERKSALDVQVLRAAGAYAQAYKLQDERVKKSPEDAELLYDQAMLADKAGDRADMERILRQIIATKPDFFHAYNALGYSFAERGKNRALSQ